MAQFDTPIQDTSTNAREFFRWTRPIQEPQPNKANAIAMQGAASAIEQGAEGLNKYAQQKATDVGEDAAVKITNTYGGITEAAHNVLFPGSIPDPAFGPKDTLTPSVNGDGYDESKVPQPVKDGVQQAHNIKAAYDQGTTPGHTRNIQYYADIYKKASELRAQWPGYRDYIDKGFEKVTGITPNANAYIKSMLEDINETLTKKAGASDFVYKQAAEKAAGGNFVAAGIANNVKAGVLTPEQGLVELSKSEAPIYAGNIAKANMNNFELGSKQAEQQARNVIAVGAIPQVQNILNTHLSSLGLTPEKIQDVVNGKTVLQPEEWTALDKSITRLEMQTRAHFDSEYSKAGVTTALGNSYKESMDNAMMPFKMWHDAIRNQDTGYLGDISRANKYASDKMLNNVWNSTSDAATFFKGVDLFNKFGGQGFAASILQGVAPPKGTELKAFMGNAMGGSQTPGLESMKKTLTAMNSVPGGAPKEDVQAYLKFPITALMNSSVPDAAKTSIIKHVFNGNDNAWIGQLNDDYTYKGSDGKDIHVTGKHGVFLAYTNPRFVKEIDRLSAHDPSLMKDYHNWVITTFSNDLFKKDVASLPDIQNRKGIDLVWVRNPGEAPYFQARPSVGTLPIETGLSPKDKAFWNSRAQKIADQTNEDLRNINTGIKSVYNVLKDGTTPELMRNFQRVDKFDTFGTPTAGGILIGAMGASHKPIEGSKKDQSALFNTTPKPFPYHTPSNMGTSANTAPPSGGAITQEANEGSKPFTDRAAPINNQYPQELHDAYHSVKGAMSTFIDRFEAAFGDAAKNYKGVTTKPDMIRKPYEGVFK